LKKVGILDRKFRKGDNIMKKMIKVLGLVAIMSLSMSMVSMADQTDRWAEQNGTWFLKNEANTGIVTNTWFQDLDGAWYLLAPGDGHMYAGLIHDTLTNRWYFCQTEHDGWYGRMAHVNGTYRVNGKEVELTFEQAHDGYFGAITSGLESLKETGIEVKDVTGIPTESASASKSEEKASEENVNNNTDSDWEDLKKRWGFTDEDFQKAWEASSGESMYGGLH
jgi:hypothetical protein